MTKDSQHNSWIACKECKGRGKKHRRLSKKARLQFQHKLDDFKSKKLEHENLKPPVRPKGQAYLCKTCNGSGLTSVEASPEPDTLNLPHIAIIGGGIGGAALAVACQHRGIPFSLYERDSHFSARSQGYGLTLQQASTAIQALGITTLTEGIISTLHVVHETNGNIIGEWGIRKWGASKTQKAPKRTNIHIARQALRRALLDQLDTHHNVHWGHRLTGIKDSQSASKAKLHFLANGKEISHTADLIVGADGIRSTVRTRQLKEDPSPLQYLGCIVILGICPLSVLSDLDSDLLDSATVFQTANGYERIYIMPYSKDSIMWQLSFPMSEDDAITLSKLGRSSLKQEASRRTQWHIPIPQIIANTDESLISGYPVYDRKMLQPVDLQHCSDSTLIGDAAHPMSPFKGQGANQALLDALSLARIISLNCRPQSGWRDIGIREAALNEFEVEMLGRASSKVKDSAEAAKFLHSETVLHNANEPRGRCLNNLKEKRKDSR